jgi:hypothetical protein
MGAGDTSFSVGSTAGWPNGGHDFVVCIDRNPTPTSGLPEEAILCASFVGTTVTVASGGRGYDGTSAVAHLAGATAEHTLDAAFLEDLSKWRFTATTKGDILYVTATAGVQFARLAISATTGKVLGVGSSGIPVWQDGLQNLMTAVGDLVIATGAGVPARLGIGGSGQVFVSNGTTAVWGSDTVEAAARASAVSAEAATRAAADTTNAAAITAEAARALAAEPAALLTASGDLLGANKAGVPVRIPVAANGQGQALTVKYPTLSSNSGVSPTTTSLAVNALPSDIPTGTVLTLVDGANTTTVTTSGDSAAGATTVTITSHDFSPHNYAAASTIITGGGGFPTWARTQLIPRAVSADTAANDRDLIMMTGAHVTTLGTPTLGKVVGVLQVTTAAASILAGTGSLLGAGIATYQSSTGATGVPLATAGAFTLWEADGTNWNLTEGAIDSGWVQFDSVLNVPWAPVSAHVYWRQQGNRVTFNGTIGSGTTATLWLAPTGAAAANPPNCVQSFLGMSCSAIHTNVPNAAQSNIVPGTNGIAATMYFVTPASNLNLDSLTYLVD